MTTMGERLEDLRRENNKKAVEVAEVLKITQPNLSKYENDLKTPTIATMLKFCKYYNVSMDFLCGLRSFDVNMDILDKPFYEDKNVLTGNLVERLSRLSDDSKRQLLEYLDLLEFREKHQK